MLSQGTSSIRHVYILTRKDKARRDATIGALAFIVGLVNLPKKEKDQNW